MQARGCQKENQELDEDIFALESAVVERQRLCELQGMQHTASHCITLQRTATMVERRRLCELQGMQHTAPHCNTLQHAATYRNNGGAPAPL